MDRLAALVALSRKPDVRHPHTECLWPIDALELTELLVTRKSQFSVLSAYSGFTSG